MREVRYVRWKAFVMVAMGGCVCLLGVGICVLSESFVPVFLLVVGAIIAHIGNLRLKEKDVILRLTPKEVWTKEFGWQAWSNLEVVLEEAKSGYTIEIRKPGNYTPRFFEYVSALAIDAYELKDWIRRFAAPAN